MATSIQIVNMTPGTMFRTQVESTVGKIRHENTGSDTPFRPSHLGGVFGQREILQGKNVMRQTKIT